MKEAATTDRAALALQGIKQVRKDYGEAAIMRLGDAPLVKVDVVPTGSLALDHALGIGGLPKGRIVEILGPEASGKTTLALHAIASAQRAGGHCAFIDAEHAMDPVYAGKLGVDVPGLYLAQPDSGEQALEIVDTLVGCGGFDVVVVDSVAALVPRAELEGEMGDAVMGLQARLMSQACRKLTGKISRTGTLVIFINQIRFKIATMPGVNPETTSGGNALRFYASVRLDVRRIGAIKDDGESVGNKTRAKVIKHKLSPPFKQAEFEIRYGVGISRHGELLDYGVQHGIIDKAGAHYSYGDDRIGHGRENAVDYLIAHPVLADEVEQRIRAAMQEEPPEEGPPDE